MRHLLAALVKRSHSRAVDTLGDHPTSVEKAALDRWSRFLAGELALLPPPRRKRLRRSDARRILSKELTDVCGLAEEWDRDQWCCTLKEKDVLVLTNFDLSSSSAQVIYAHEIAIPDSPMRVAEGIALLSWLGISAETGWSIEDATTELAACERALVAMCSHFVAACDDLLML
jgi:hypothetical protein